MPKSTMMDEIHVIILAPATLEKEAGTAVIRTLRSRAFQRSFRVAVRDVFRCFPSLEKVRFRIDR